MIIREAIDKADRSKPNTYTDEDKISWLAYLDGIILKETILSHEEGPKHRTSDVEEASIIFPLKETDIPDTKYTVDSFQTELLAPYPFDELYVAYIKMKIDEENGETTRYNNSATMFNALYTDYLKFYHRTHFPKRTTIRYK